jgi:hypothetical protein
MSITSRLVWFLAERLERFRDTALSEAFFQGWNCGVQAGQGIRDGAYETGYAEGYQQAGRDHVSDNDTYEAGFQQGLVEAEHRDLGPDPYPRS